MNTKTPLERLASLSVQEAFGSTVQLVGDVLQSRGELTLPQIVKFVRESAQARLNNYSVCDGEEDSEEDDDDYDYNDNRGPSNTNTSAKRRRRRLGVVLHGRRRPKPWDRSSVRAALAVLLQHEIVSVRTTVTTIMKSVPAPPPPSGGPDLKSQRQTNRRTRRLQQQQQAFHYTFDREPALRLLRYAKYVEFFKRFVLVGDEVAATALQCLLLAGRLRTCDWIVSVVAKLTVVDPRYTAREQAVEAAHKLESLGFVTRVAPAFRGEKGSEDNDGDASTDDDDDDDHEGEEFEFEGPERPSHKKKRVRIDKAAAANDKNIQSQKKKEKSSSAAAGGGGDDEDPIVVAILNGSAHYKNSLLPVDRVWRVNFRMLHAYQRSIQLGRLVAERYGHKVQSCGSLVTAALKHRAQVQHNPNERPSDGARGGGGGGPTDDVDANVRFVVGVRTFSPIEIIKYVPKTVLQILEKKPGGLHRNLAKAFDDLVIVAEHPVVIKPSNVAATHAAAAPSVVDPDVPQTRYEVHVGALTRYLQERIIHQVVSDRHDVVAARVVSILWRVGYLEAETIADHAMVPVKEAREVLHCLYRSNYVDLIQLSASAGGSSSRSTTTFGSYSSSLYLWGVRKLRLKNQVLDNVAKAYVNVRLRRHHELDVGKQWIQRARQADDTDENDHEKDRLNYTKFCLGLERLDVAALQLDDTLLVLDDFC